MVLAQLQNTWHNCKIHGTTAKQIVKLQINARQQNKCFLTPKLPATPPCHCIADASIHFESPATTQ